MDPGFSEGGGLTTARANFFLGPLSTASDKTRNGTKRNGTKRNETKWKRSSKVCTLMKYDETSGPSLRLAGRQWL